MATGAVAAGVGTVRIGSGRLRAWYYALPDEAATRGLSPQCERALVRVVETLVDEPVETAHYSDFFRWRAEHLSGHGAF